jgi:hypothetical protein
LRAEKQELDAARRELSEALDRAQRILSKPANQTQEPSGKLR